uniref:ATP synthase subunit b n=1 Tax=Amphora coffeiformis TaxID=265554 RepID=A0A7S3LAT6_9STRA|mmetsp:Transcript_16185/g.32531  ORF Transcript_16185/g.32531 Transcript_16185/m.32531 type:complete len:295 (-) Transcript_16185:52-936(-)
MFRAAGSQLIRHSRTASRQSLPGLAPSVNFHASLPRAKEEEAVPEAKSSSWDPLYALPLGIALAVPAIQYEWYLVNEETQLMACFIAFTSIIYKQFGGVIQEALEADGKRVLAEHNAAEDQVISSLKVSIENIKSQESLADEITAVKALKAETYAKLNKVGEVKPLYDFKAQVEKLLSMISHEEAVMQEKGKTTLMAEATEAVKKSFAENADLKKAALTSAIAALKGTKSGTKDPVQSAYLAFFANKKKATAKVDAAAEAAAAREAIVMKLNSTAMNEGYYFQFDASGKPKMVV